QGHRLHGRVGAGAERCPRLRRPYGHRRRSQDARVARPVLANRSNVERRTPNVARRTSTVERVALSRFLLVRLGALGDIVHGIPVAAALRRALPSARIDWLVSAKHREILDLVPVIDRRLVVDDRSGAGGGTSLVAAIRDLRKTRYD